MMGCQGGEQEQLFYSFSLEQHIPANHLLRGIDRYLDLADLRAHLAPFYSHTGRPSIDPELMIRMLIVGYCYGIRSERRLCEEVHLNLAYRWFCGLGLQDAVPDHSTFSKNRHGRFRESNTLRHVFEGVLRRCVGEGLVGGEGFAIDASVVRADANRARGIPGNEVSDWHNGSGVTRAVGEYLAALDKSDPAESVPKSVSLTDPGARYTAAPGGPAFYGYSTNYLVDIKAGIIVDVEATPSHRTHEVNATRTMINRVEARFQLKPQRLIGDTAYGTAEVLGWLVEEKRIAPHVPVWDKSQRSDGTLSASDFVWNEHTNEYRCPAGHALRALRRPFKTPRTGITQENTIRYRASQFDCLSCPMKQQCSPNTPRRQITRSIHERARDEARRIATTEQYRQSRKDRKKVEMLFAHLKRILKLDRLRLRGLSGASDEFLMAATVQNLRRMAKWLMPITQNVNPAPV
jgi:transposase